MTKSGFKSVDEYIASHPMAVQGVLKLVRSTIRKAVPGAEEVISYKVPMYKLHGGPVLYFAGWRQHYSLYPATDHVVAAFEITSGAGQPRLPWIRERSFCTRSVFC